MFPDEIPEDSQDSLESAEGEVELSEAKALESLLETVVLSLELADEDAEDSAFEAEFDAYLDSLVAEHEEEL